MKKILLNKALIIFMTLLYAVCSVNVYADTPDFLKDTIVDGCSVNSARTLIGYFIEYGVIGDEGKKPEEPSERITQKFPNGEKFPKDMQLDNYVYEYDNNLNMQVIDNDKIYEVLDKLEKGLGIGKIKVVRYNDTTDVFRLELPVLVTREITEKIYNNENVTYAAPPILRLIKEY